MDTFVQQWPAGESVEVEKKLRMIEDVFAKVYPSLELDVIREAIAECRLTVPPRAPLGRFAAEVNEYLGLASSVSSHR